MNFKSVPPTCDNLVNVIVETPRGSRNKFDFDPDLKIFRLKKVLPTGMVFPFDFGFIPNTRAEDGDPVDALVIMDEQAYPGCLVECRLIGILEAWQKEIDAPKVRNDRLVAVADCSILYADLLDIKDLNKNIVKELENFFIDYNRHEGKKFIPIGWGVAAKGLKKIKQHIVQ